MALEARRPFRANLREVFLKGFKVMDIAEPLVSLDAEHPSDGLLDESLNALDPFGGNPRVNLHPGRESALLKTTQSLNG